MARPCDRERVPIRARLLSEASRRGGLENDIGSDRRRPATCLDMGACSLVRPGSVDAGLRLSGMARAGSFDLLGFDEVGPQLRRRELHVDAVNPAPPVPTANQARAYW